MKKLSIIIFILASFKSIGQKCDTIEGQIYNCTDSCGNKFGLWRVQKKELDFCKYECFGKDQYCKYTERYRFNIFAQGYYVANKKIGTWKYYSGHNDTNYVESVVTFYNNGTVKEDDLYYNSVIEYSKDSLVINGYVYREGDTIKVGYSNKKCMFKLKYDVTIMTVDCPDFKIFDLELSKLKYGIYDRNIFITKQNVNSKRQKLIKKRIRK
jgi:hypothetical protein